ncbi:DNHD1, partial [Symbiodinium sp. CCMP2456]
RTARESNAEAAPSERSSAKRTASSNTLRAVKAAYKVPSRPGSPDSHDEVGLAH